MSSESSPTSSDYLTSPRFAARVESYDVYAHQLADMGNDALANIDYPEGFSRVVEEWSKNYKYKGADGSELRTAIIGEILSPVWGTMIRAHGNFYAKQGDDFTPIDDRVKVKDTIALGIPESATIKMFNTFMNQTNSLDQVLDSDADEDRRKGNNPFVRSWTRSTRGEGSEVHDVIVTHMLPKYAVPSAAGAPKPKRVAKRKLDEVDEPPPVAMPSSDPDAVPSGDDIKLGAHYEPSLLEDYGGPFFNHVKAKLVQLDVRDKNNKLIPPWKFYDALKPGALVLVLGSLHCFIMQDESGPKEKRERKIYQINAHSVRVLDEGYRPTEKRTRPSPPNGVGVSSVPFPSRDPAKASPFDRFAVQTAQSGDVEQDEGDGEVTNTSDGAKAKGKARRNR